MIGEGKQSVFVRILILGVLTICLVLLSSGGKIAGNSSQKASVPSVSVQPQSNAPLRINVLSYDSSDPRTPEIIYEVTNVSVKPIRAYTVSQETLRGTEKSEGSVLSDLDLSAAVLQPGQYSTESITYQPLSEKPSQVTLSIDFVEFADGTTWGPNLYKSADMLAGQRAGAREARKHILQVYKSGGLQAALKLIETDSDSVTPPSGRTLEWEEGFRYGYSFLSKRLKRIFDSGDTNKIEAEARRLSEK